MAAAIEKKSISFCTELVLGSDSSTLALHGETLNVESSKQEKCKMISQDLGRSNLATTSSLLRRTIHAQLQADHLSLVSSPNELPSLQQLEALEVRIFSVVLLNLSVFNLLCKITTPFVLFSEYTDLTRGEGHVVSVERLNPWFVARSMGFTPCWRASHVTFYFLPITKDYLVDPSNVFSIRFSHHKITTPISEQDLQSFRRAQKIQRLALLVLDKKAEKEGTPKKPELAIPFYCPKGLHRMFGPASLYWEYEIPRIDTTNRADPRMAKVVAEIAQRIRTKAKSLKERILAGQQLLQGSGLEKMGFAIPHAFMSNPALLLTPRGQAFVEAVLERMQAIKSARNTVLYAHPELLFTPMGESTLTDPKATVLREQVMNAFAAKFGEKIPEKVSSENLAHFKALIQSTTPASSQGKRAHDNLAKLSTEAEEITKLREGAISALNKTLQEIGALLTNPLTRNELEKISADLTTFDANLCRLFPSGTKPWGNWLKSRRAIYDLKKRISEMLES